MNVTDKKAIVHDTIAMLNSGLTELEARPLGDCRFNQFNGFSVLQL